ncbi:MAG: hypothetical protein JWR88_2581 [Pseudonocardia sp.]|nr:hypothetical protein [Pseudonocardia sp.]
MTRRRRKSNPPSVSAEAAMLQGTARLIRDHLRRRRVDAAPVAELAPTLGVTDATLRAAVAREADLGLCGEPDAQQVWWLPPAALAAGFEPMLLRGELTLRLAAADPGLPPLQISGRHVGAAPDAERDLPELRRTGIGPLAYMLARLSLMAEPWLTAAHKQRPGGLLERVAAAWRSSPAPAWSSGSLRIYQGREADPSAPQLELVVWVDDRGSLQLVNFYPAGTHRDIFEQEACGG